MADYSNRTNGASRGWPGNALVPAMLVVMFATWSFQAPGQQRLVRHDRDPQAVRMGLKRILLVRLCAGSASPYVF